MQSAGKRAVLLLPMLLPVLLALAGIAVPAQAQIPAPAQCALPQRLEVQACPRQSHGPARGEAGDFDHYILSFSWSPAFCATVAGTRSPLQCTDNRFGWIIHGLWPQYAAGRGGPSWPQYCRPVAPVPEAVLRRHLCASPDPRLMQCEWAKHGSCTDFDGPEAYFAAAGAAAARLVLPDPPPDGGDILPALLAANRGLEAAQVRVVRRGSVIRELRICLDRALRHPVPCGP